MIDGMPFGTEHNLNEIKHIEPIKLKRRSLAPERNTATYKEVDELVRAGILKVVKYQTSVANPVMVKKNDGGWRMCVDFTISTKHVQKTITPCQKQIGRSNPFQGFP